MSDFILSRQQRFWMIAQPTFGVIPNTSGTGTAPSPTRGIKWQAKNMTGLLTRRDKTGTRMPNLGNQGRQYGKWQLEGSLTTGGDVGTTLPDLDPFWSSIFTAHSAGVVSAGVSVTYTMADAIRYFTGYDYGTSLAGAATDARAAGSCVPTQVTFNVNQDVAEFTAEGECKYVVRSKAFSGLNADQKQGLTSFTAEPGSSTFHGNLVQGFLGVATLNSVVLSDHIVSAQIIMRSAAEVVKNTFGTTTPSSAEGDEYNIGVSLSLYDDVGADVETLKEVSETKTPINLSFQIGSTAGSIITLSLVNVILGDSDVDKNSQRRSVVNFSEGRAYGTSPSAYDALTMVMT